MGSAQGLGGLQTHFLRLLSFLSGEGHVVSAIVVADGWVPSDAPPGVELAGILPHSTSGMLGRIRKLIALRKVERAARHFKADVFVAAALGRAYAAVARSARSAGAFTVWQEVVVPRSGDALHIEMTRSVDAVALQTACMVAPFRSAVPEARRVGYLPCFYDPPAVDVTAYPPTPGGEIRLAFFGRLAGNKGLIPFLEVFREVAEGHRLKLDVHGAGEVAGEIEAKIAACGLAGRVRLMGRYPEGAEYSRLLASYHGLVLPSVETEGLPLVLLEAMACGLPFFSTAIGGIPDAAAGNPDVMVVPAEPSALRSGFEQWLAMLRSGSISNARLRNFAATRFSNEAFEEVWRRMLSGPQDFFDRPVTGK